MYLMINAKVLIEVAKSLKLNATFSGTAKSVRNVSYNIKVFDDHSD